MLRKIEDEILQRDFIEALTHPVEAWTEVVDEFLVWVDFSDFRGEGRGVGDVWCGCFEPEEIGVGGEGDGAFGCGGDAGAVVVVAFACAGDVGGPGYWG